MTIITKQDLVDSLVGRYRTQMGVGRTLLDGRQTSKIIQELEAESSLTESRALEIVGNDSWLRNECDECRQDVDVTVTLGREPDYDSSTASICLACLEKAIGLARPLHQ